MRPVETTIPDAQDVVALPIDDLAMRVLRHFAEEGNVNRHNLTNKPSWLAHGSGR